MNAAITRARVAIAIVLALGIAIPLQAACWIAATYKCGVSPTPSTYVVACSAYPPKVEFCNGTSLGMSRPTVATAATGYFGYRNTVALCMAPVTIVGVCCGGSRTATTDWTPVLDQYPEYPGCVEPAPTK
jgi:hypothetical protein